MCCPDCETVLIKYPLLLIEKNSLCGANGIPLEKYVRMIIWMTAGTGAAGAVVAGLIICPEAIKIVFLVSMF